MQEIPGLKMFPHRFS